MPLIRKMKENDIDAVALVHSRAFPRQTESRSWIECNFKAYPRMQFFVIEIEKQILGFIHWTQKSGFRSEVVLELEQMAVEPNFQGRGLGKSLICESLPLVQKQLAKRNATIKHILVTTRADNHAQELYHKVLGAEVEATITNLYSADEVLMIARNIILENNKSSIGNTHSAGLQIKR